MRDVDWLSWTCELGWPVQGIFMPSSDGADVNTVDRSNNGDIIATGDTFSKIRLMRYPALKKVKANEYVGHCSHVMNVRWMPNDSHLISVGGNDCTIFQWRHVDRNGSAVKLSSSAQSRKRQRVAAAKEVIDFEGGLGQKTHTADPEPSKPILLNVSGLNEGNDSHAPLEQVQNAEVAPLESGTNVKKTEPTAAENSSTYSENNTTRVEAEGVSMPRGNAERPASEQIAQAQTIAAVDSEKNDDSSKIETGLTGTLEKTALQQPAEPDSVVIADTENHIETAELVETKAETSVAAPAEEKKAEEMRDSGEVEDSSESKAGSEGKSNESPGVIFKAKATFDYEAADDDEVSFKEGDILLVTTEDVDWWSGTVERTGSTGQFPANHVEKLG